MTKGNNFESGGAGASGDMTPEEVLAARGFYAKPSEEGESFYTVHGENGEEKKIPMGDVSGRLLGRGEYRRVGKVGYQVIGGKAVRGLTLSYVKQRLFG